MKNGSMFSRAGYSLRGCAVTWRSERSLRTHVALSLGLLALLLWYGASAIWLCLIGLAIALGWAMELANAAIEALCDRLHPDRDPAIGMVKDMASAAAFIVNMALVLLAILAFTSGG